MVYPHHQIHAHRGFHPLHTHLPDGNPLSLAVGIP